jgi:hypothetical protein
LEDFERVLSYTSQVSKLQKLAEQKQLMARCDMATRLSRLETKADRIEETLSELLDTVRVLRARSSSRAWWQEYAPGKSSRTKQRRWARRKQQTNTSLQRAFVRNVIVGCGLPFAASEWKGLRDFFAVLQPKFKAPTRGKATRLFSEYADRVLDSVRAEVQDVLRRPGACVSVAADAWQGVGARDFFAVMVSWIDDDFSWQQRVVAARPLGDVKDADAIMQKLKSVFKDDFGVEPASKIFMITLDNEAAGLRAASALGLSVVRCSAHCVQIAVKRILFYASSEHKELIALIEDVRTIVRHFRNSTQAAKRLQKIQARIERPPRVVILDGETRWNSTLNMSGACCLAVS